MSEDKKGSPDRVVKLSGDSLSGGGGGGGGGGAGFALIFLFY